MEKKQSYSMTKAVFTDIQFWIPVGILIIGILILSYVA